MFVSHFVFDLVFVINLYEPFFWFSNILSEKESWLFYFYCVLDSCLWSLCSDKFSAYCELSFSCNGLKDAPKNDRTHNIICTPVLGSTARERSTNMTSLKLLYLPSVENTFFLLV